MSQYLNISWDDFYKDTCQLGQNLKGVQEWKGIIAIARGGLVPATVVARELGIRLIDTICMTSYCDETDTQMDLTVLKSCNLEDGGRGWLVIDDLTDTGVTARAVRALLPHVHIASVYAKPQGRVDIDTCTTEVTQNTWIVFPWEV